MPYVKLNSDLQLYYITNTPNGDVSKFDPAKETILLFHPLFLDTSFLKPQFEDPRFANKYNMISFDNRCSGRTKSKPSPLRDSWVDAVDVAFACELLGIRRCHVYASMMNSVHAGIRFAILFPQKVLSLCLCQIPATKEMDWVPAAYAELLELWCFPPDVESVERACIELGYLMFNNNIIPEDIADEVYAHWQVHFAANRRTVFLDNVLVCFNRRIPEDDVLQHLHAPTIVLQGDAFVVNPMDQAEAVTARIPNAQLVVIKGGPEAWTMVPSCATIGNRVYTTFLSRLPPPPPPLPPTKPRKEKEFIQDALKTLARVYNDPKIAKRSATLLSFNMNPPEITEQNKMYFKRFQDGEKNAVTALGKDGLPVRKMSTRNDDEWIVNLKQ